jgi:hypothetical protein
MLKIKGNAGIKAGFEGRAAGGKTINEAVKAAGIPPIKEITKQGFRQDKWVPQRTRPSREDE